MEANMIPERPSRVKLALQILYLSLGISVIRVLLIWRLAGFPGPAVSFLLSYFLLIALFNLQGPMWLLHGDLIIFPIALWLYYMIGRGKDWARIIALNFIILAILESMMSAPLTLPPLTFEGVELSYFLTSAHVVQGVLKIAAIALLFGRVSSDWFRAMKARNQNIDGSR